jgi:hypothetical protein
MVVFILLVMLELKVHKVLPLKELGLKVKLVPSEHKELKVQNRWPKELKALKVLMEHKAPKAMMVTMVMLELKV